METSSPARLYASLFGAVLVVAGIIGFFYEPSFGTGDAIQSDEVLGLLAVNGWHNVVHIVLGMVGLAMAGTNSAARTYCLGVGVVYLALTVWGFMAVEDGFGVLIDLVPVNTEDNFLHLILGLLAIAAGLSSPVEEPPGPAAAAA